MKVTHALVNMKDTSYNSLGGTLLPCENKQRIGFKLESGKQISVRPECLLLLNKTDISIRGPCCVCFEDTRNFECKSMPCQHILCGTCWNKMDRNYKTTLENRLNTMGSTTAFIQTDDVFDNPSARCPVCKVLVTPVTSMWYEQPVTLIMMQNLGCICQLYHRFKRLPEPSLSEEVMWIDRCEKLAEKQVTKSGLAGILDSFEAERQTFMRKPLINSQEYAILEDKLMQLIILHVVHPCFDEDAIKKAINCLLVEGR